MKIGIDARFLTHPQRGGFKTYTTNLIAALAEVDAENEYVLYLDRPPDRPEQLPAGPNFTARLVPGSAPLVGLPWREQIRLARQAGRDRLDVLHSPSLTAPLQLACPSVVTIHDMIWYFPQKFSNGQPTSPARGRTSGKRKLMEWYYQYVPKAAAQRAAAVVTVSYAAKESIVQHLGLSPERIFVTHEAASPIYRRVNDPVKLAQLRQEYNLASAFILAIGSADPRKNMQTLVQAYALLPAVLRERYQLAIVWTHSFLAAELAEQVRALGIANQVRFLERVSNEALVLLYNAASLFVFPSLYEGFGLPLLEAMACGAPVVAANNSSIPEIVAEAAVLVEAQDIKAMAGAIAGVLSYEALKDALIEKGLKQAARFSWTKCARETLAVYGQALSS